MKKTKKSYGEINEKIKSGKAVVLTAEEMIDHVEEKGEEQTFKEVDVVTTGTFGAMCSSGAFMNFGNTEPPIRMTRVWLNDVLAYAGLAAVDAFLGATELSRSEGMSYGGAHVIEDLLKNKEIHLKASSPGTDCYPRKEVDTYITLEELNQAYLYNPRNGYQNYGVAVNSSSETLYTYMGTLLPDLTNATFSSAGQLSPLLNDPYYRTIGVGTKIFLGGAEGFVTREGTQHNPQVTRNSLGIPEGGAGTMAVTGSLKEMDPRYIRAAELKNYGVSMYVGLGIPIPILDREMVKFTSVRDSDISTYVEDYASDKSNKPVLGKVNYEQLRSGKIVLANGREVATSSLSSYKMAREIAGELKERIRAGNFTITRPVRGLKQNTGFKDLTIRKREG